MEEIIIPKEKANFWLDKNSNWHNQNGKFEHKKISDYFHASISKDRMGYHLRQINNNRLEKVYFQYEDTALFVFKITITDKGIEAILNTHKIIQIPVESLFIKKDHLYATLSNDIIKFNERTLLEISEIMTYREDLYYLNLNNKVYQIPMR